MKKCTVVCSLGGLLVALLWPTLAIAGAPTYDGAVGVVADGTPNLGTAAIQTQDARWFVEGRIYDVDDNTQEWSDNTTFSLGFAAPINEKTEFNLAYSVINNTNADPIGGGALGTAWDRSVLAPYLKRVFSNDGDSAISLTIGADVALSQAEGTSAGGTAYEDDFTPAAKLQLEWGDPGEVQWQLAAQVAFWDTWAATDVDGAIPGFGTVVGLGGGISVPMGAKLTLVGDVMGIAKGENVVNSTTGAMDNQLIWSAGGNWLLGGPSSSVLKVFATNAMGPTPATSIIGAPDNSVGFGLAWLREF
jgi:hypothetical protein